MAEDHAGTGTADLGAVPAARGLAAGSLTSVELVQACLDRITEREDDLHAWAHLDAELALAQAHARDAEPRRGPLHGLPIGVKDIIDTADLPTEYGSPIHAGHQPDRDAALVTWLRGAGAVVLGKTVTTEFAVFHPGPTRNPRDPTRTPGGSSSGSAAAVAAGMVPLALGTQTAGSIVRPASFCGIAGLKPTFGRFPVDGVHPVAPSLDTAGVLAREVADLALFAGLDLPPGDAGELAVGFAPTARWRDAEPATRAALRDLAARLALPTVDLPAEFEDLVAAQEVVMAFEAVDALGSEQRRGTISPELDRLLEQGRQVSRAERNAALALAGRCRSQLATVLAEAGVAALVTPAVIGEAPVGLDTTGDPLFCRAWTLLGVPCVAVPGLAGPAGLPLGVQVVAAHGADDAALTAARQIERALSHT